MPQFRTKKHGAHKGQVLPIEGPTGLPKGKSALKKNVIDLHVQNEKELKVEVPKEKSAREVSPLPHAPTVPQKPKKVIET